MPLSFFPIRSINSPSMVSESSNRWLSESQFESLSSYLFDWLPVTRMSWAIGTDGEVIIIWKSKYSGRQAMNSVAFGRTWYSGNVDDWNETPCVSAITKQKYWIDFVFCFHSNWLCAVKVIDVVATVTSVRFIGVDKERERQTYVPIVTGANRR